MATFAQLVDAAAQRTVKNAAPFVPSRAQYEAEYQHLMYFLDDLSDAWAFIKETHRGAGTQDAVVSELYKQHQRCRVA